MKKCKECGRLCVDSAGLCRGCGHSNFVMLTEDGEEIVEKGPDTTKIIAGDKTPLENRRQMDTIPMSQFFSAADEGREVSREGRTSAVSPRESREAADDEGGSDDEEVHREKTVHRTSEPELQPQPQEKAETVKEWPKQPEAEEERPKQSEAVKERPKQAETEKERPRQPEAEKERPRQPEAEKERPRQPEAEKERSKKPAEPKKEAKKPAPPQVNYYNQSREADLRRKRNVTKSQFYKESVAPELKHELHAAYTAMVLSIGVFLLLLFLQGDYTYVIDITLMAVSLLVLRITKSRGFAIVAFLADIAAFVFACFFARRLSGILPVLLAGWMILLMHRIQRDWKEYKQTSRSVRYNAAFGKKQGKGKIVLAVVLAVFVLAVVGVVTVKLYRDGAIHRYQPGKWDAFYFENRSLGVAFNLPDDSWSIGDGDTLKTLGMGNDVTVDCYAVNVSHGYAIAVHDMGWTRKDSKELAESRKKEWKTEYEKTYQNIQVTGSGSKSLSGKEYEYFEIYGSLNEEGIYQRVYLRAVGVNAHEIVLTGAKQEQLDEMEQYFCELK